MRIGKYINKVRGPRDFGTLIAIDIDETIFKTFAEIKVIKNGKEIKSLTNQEFNTYELQDGESFDFREFRDSELFRRTSVPIPKTIERINRMLDGIIENTVPDIILLTARADFKDKEPFLQTFRDHGIPIDKIYIERAGNLKTGTTSERKQMILMKYLMTGKYTDVKLLDDDLKNVKTFSEMGKCLEQEVYDMVRKAQNLGDEMVTINFSPLLVDHNGNIRRIE